MTDELKQDPLSSGSFAAVLGRARKFRANAGRNFSETRQFLRVRSRDRRFDLVPYDGWQIANALAVLATGLGLLAFIADVPAIAWRKSLPSDLGPLFEAFNFLGEGSWVYVLCAALLAVSVARDLSEVPARHRAHNLTRAAATSYVLVAVVLAGIIAAILKWIIGRARPRLFEDVGPFAFDFMAPTSSWAGFPSGHATTIFALAMTLALLVPRLRVLFLLAGFWIAFARVATGAHYPSDVLGGFVLGTLVAWLMARALARRRLVFRFDEAGSLKPLGYLGWRTSRRR